jgi:hypothetical protein
MGSQASSAHWRDKNELLQIPPYETIYDNAQIRSACASHNITDIGYGDILMQVKSEELRI